MPCFFLLTVVAVAVSVAPPPRVDAVLVGALEPRGRVASAPGLVAAVGAVADVVAADAGGGAVL